ncbi:kinase-like protein [Jaminaea rosea]|uniref:non-specific serine/threonine protein kinase n=1 Tax=Jaminaea rosea TaxID=1569628 RepID=A0A316UGD2_9BASI|nr:kinase-like protein [Jaminaea rosea]PWN24322.1 kinase-like protein [Jaminaea rosea]
MEYCAAGDLHNFIHSVQDEHKRSSDLCRMAAELVCAVHHCHYGMGPHYLLHGDIKPSNVLIAADGTVKLADFGLSRLKSGGHLERWNFVGTPGYTAPEILRRFPYGPASDVWSLGCTLYELFTSRRVEARWTECFRSLCS